MGPAGAPACAGGDGRAMDTIDTAAVSGVPGEHLVPQVEDALGFGADCALFSALAIAMGLPLYHFLGIPHAFLIAAVYFVSAGVLATCMPYIVWLVRWGRPITLRVRVMVRHAFRYMLPALVVIALIVALDRQDMLIGVSVMAFVVMLLTGITGDAFLSRPAPRRLMLARIGCAVLTPLVVLGLTQVLPHGAEMMAGWAIPVPVAAAGAIGASRAFTVQMRLRDQHRFSR